MPKLLDHLAAGVRPLLWLDDAAYSDKLLAGGKTPWLDGAEYTAFRRKAHGLLRPDFVVVPVGRIAAAWAASHAPLRDAMAVKKRAVAPARTLLAEVSLRSHIVELLKGLRTGVGGGPLVLSIPSPRAWVAEAYQLAFGVQADVEVGGDEADACAVYIAEFVRSFGDSGVDGLLLEERAGAEPVSADELGWYRPIINIAGHYRWDLGARLPTAEGFSGDATGLQFVISPKAISGVANGIALPDAFWSGGVAPPPPRGGFRFASIPQDGVPENVLERLNSLRA